MAGQPPYYDTPEAIGAEIDKYFEWAKGETETQVADGGSIEVIKRPAEPITITGLCIFLGFESRQSFYDQEKREGFSYIIKRARMRVENAYEKNLQGNSVAGSIFALKNMGWQDKTQQEVSGGLDIGKKPSWFDNVDQKTA